MSLIVAFYKDRGHFFNRMVNWWTGGPYSHVELLFNDGKSASSSNRDRGVRYKYIQYSADRWDFIELDDKFSDADARAFFDKNSHRKYDYLGLFGFVWRAHKGSKNRLFCSESVMSALGFKESWRYCPNTCYSVLQRFKNE